MKSNFFDYLETSTHQERQAIAEELKALFFGALDDEAETFSKARQDKKSHKAREAYLESVQRVGALLDVFDVLHIDAECLRDEWYKTKN